MAAATQARWLGMAAGARCLMCLFVDPDPVLAQCVMTRVDRQSRFDQCGGRGKPPLRSQIERLLIDRSQKIRPRVGVLGIQRQRQTIEPNRLCEIRSPHSFDAAVVVDHRHQRYVGDSLRPISTAEI